MARRRPTSFCLVTILLITCVFALPQHADALDWKLFKDSEDGGLDLSDWLMSKGGFRYLIARKFNMHVGADIARGPEDTAFYLQMGHAWAR